MGMFDVMKKNAVVLEKPSGTVAIRADLTAIQRKFYNGLLWIAKQRMKKNPNKKIFTAALVDLKFLLGQGERDKNNEYYLARLEELVYKVVEYNYLGKDKIVVRDKFVLLPRLKVVERKTTKEETYITYEFTENVRRALMDPNGIYANINLVVIRGLKSKYAVILYELTKDYERAEIPEMELEDFKKLFGVEDKYEQVWDLRKRVLDVAVKELNENENVDFMVSYELRKTGRKYTHIKFTVRPKPIELKLQQQAIGILEEEIKQNADLREILSLIPEQYRAKRTCVSLLLGALNQKGKDYLKAQIEYTNQKSPNDYCAYLKKAIEEDYAGAEALEIPDLQPIQEQEEWLNPDSFAGMRFRFKEKPGAFRLAHIDPQPDGEGYYAVRFDHIDDPDTVHWTKLSQGWLMRTAEEAKKRQKSPSASESAHKGQN